MSDMSQKDPLPGNTRYTSNIRLEALRTYTPNRVRDAWASMGGQALDYYAKVINRNSIFKLINSTTNTCPLNGYIFFCDADIQLQSNFSWSNMQINLSPEGVPDGTVYDATTSIIHPNLFWVLSATDFNNIVIPFDPSFIPFAELQGVGVDPNSDVIIDETDLNQILIDLGVPFINIDELEYSRSQILNLMVLPAIKEYYKWFPITTRVVYPATATFFNIPIPNYAVGVVSVYANPNYLNNSAPNNPFSYFSELAYGGSPGAPMPQPNLNSRRRRGFPDTMAIGTVILERAVRASVVNYAKRQRVAVHLQQGCITGYVNTMSVIEVTWASFSNQWRDIPFDRQTLVRDLAKAYVLRGFAMLRGQENSELAGTVKYDHFLTRADKLEADVMKVFQESTKSSIVRT